MKRALIGILAALAALAPAMAFADIAAPTVMERGGTLIWVLVIAIIVIVAAVLFFILRKRKK